MEASSRGADGADAPGPTWARREHRFSQRDVTDGARLGCSRVTISGGDPAVVAAGSPTARRSSQDRHAGATGPQHRPWILAFLPSRVAQPRRLDMTFTLLVSGGPTGLVLCPTGRLDAAAGTVLLQAVKSVDSTVEEITLDLRGVASFTDEAASILRRSLASDSRNGCRVRYVTNGGAGRDVLLAALGSEDDDIGRDAASSWA